MPHREKQTIVFKIYLFGCPASGQKTFLQFLLHNWNLLDAAFKKSIESERSQLTSQINTYMQNLKELPSDLKRNLNELIESGQYDEARQYYEVCSYRIQQLCRSYDVEINRFMDISVKKLQSSKLNNQDPENASFSFVDLVGSTPNLLYRIYFTNQSKPDPLELNTFLSGIDGLIFIWDAQRARLEENSRVFQALINNLPLRHQYPLVIALNKVDLPDTLRSEDLRRLLTQIQFEKRLQTTLFTEDLYPGLTIFETAATQGLNLKKVIRNCVRMIYNKFQDQIKELNRQILMPEVQT